MGLPAQCKDYPMPEACEPHGKMRRTHAPPARRACQLRTASTASPTPYGTSWLRPGRRSHRENGPVPEHRRPDSLRISHPPGAGRHRRASHARRPEQLRALDWHPAGARRRRPGVERPRLPVVSDRVLITAGTSEGIELALTALVESGRRGAGAVADLPALHRGARQDWRRARVLPDRPGTRLGAGPRSSREPRHAPDARARPHRSEQSDRRRLPDSSAARARRARRAPRARDPGRRGVRRPRRTTVRYPRSEASSPTRRSSRSPVSRRPTSRPAGARAGSRSAAPRGWTTCSRR